MCTDVIVPLLRVLESLTTLSVLHRDIKPENIFLAADGTMRLGDSGLAIDSTAELPFCRSGARFSSCLDGCVAKAYRGRQLASPCTIATFPPSPSASSR